MATVIRTAVEGDFPAMIEMGREMHKASRYAAFDFDDEKVLGMLRHVVLQGLTFVAETDGEVVGMFIGRSGEHYFGRGTTSTDLLTYVPPERRGGVGIRLVREYKRRAVALGIEDIRIGESAGILPDRVCRLYERLGFRRAGGSYVLEE